MTDKIFGIHAQTLLMRAERAQILSANIANSETPGYKSRDINSKAAFSHVLDRESVLKTTRANHMSDVSDLNTGIRLQYRIPHQPSLDGNTVDMQIERSQFMQNSLMYQASLTIC